MPEWNDEPDAETDANEFDGPSKSARKRQMHALQALGESLLELSEKQMERVPIEDPKLLAALAECRRISSNSARKRQLQFIGKLMRAIDPEPIEQALAELRQGRQQATADFHQLEALRDTMLAAGPGGVELALARWPQADRQHLRQLLMQHQKEIARKQPPGAQRKLFRYLRELQENYGESG